MVDKSAILQIFGSLMQHPQYLSETDKYTLTPDDFYYRIDKFIFVAIDTLYRNGATKIQPLDIKNFMETDESAALIFRQNNTIEYLQDAYELCEVSNFNYYYNRLKKFNLLSSLQANGIDTTPYYVEKATQPNDFQINEQFEILTINNIIDDLKKKLITVERNYIQNDTTEVQNVNYHIEDVINSFHELEDVGLPVQGEIFNEVLSGARKGTFVVRSASSGTGKALPNSTIIPTPSGMRRVDEIKVGDYLFDAFGKPTKVLGVYPQGRKEVNFVRFKDGRVSYCCDEHLWSYCTIGQKDWAKKERKFYTKTLRELKNEPLKDKEGTYKILVPMQYAVTYPEKQFYIPPYVFGLALGDGSFRQNVTNKSFQYSSEDDYLPNCIAEYMGWITKRGSKNNFSWYFATKETQENQFDKINVWVEDFLKDYPELINVTSKDKFIPTDYLYGSIEQRFELLNGLLDSDGSVDSKGHVTFFTISPKLRDNVVDLCRSLGFKTTVLVDTHKDTNVGYEIHITGRPQDKNKLFKLPRKRQRVDEWYNNDDRKESNDFNPIVEIGSCGYTEEMTCFYVDNEEHLFLTEDYIVTHNTRHSVADACYLSFPIRYNWEKRNWEHTGSCEKTLLIATEQTLPEVQRMVIAYISGINEAKFRYGDFAEEEIRVLHQTQYILNKYQENMYIVRMPNPSIELLKTIIRENVLTHDIEYVFFDYIFICPSLLHEFSGFGLRNDEILLMVSTALKDLAVELNIFVLSSTQVNANINNNQDIKNESNIAGSRAIINKADIGCVISRPTKEELDFISNNMQNFIMPNCVTDIYKVRSGQWNQCRIWSVMDLGTMRKQDLFVTDARFNPLENFGLFYNYTTEDEESRERYEVDLKELAKVN